MDILREEKPVYAGRNLNKGVNFSLSFKTRMKLVLLLLFFEQNYFVEGKLNYLFSFYHQRCSQNRWLIQKVKGKK